MVTVRAIRKGYAGHEVREIGDVFEWPEGHKVGSWVVPVGSKVEEVAKDEGKGKTDDDKSAGKGKGKGKAETIKAATAEPFADAPAPQVVKKGNGVQDELGGPAPDWLPPSADDKPVQADD